MDLHEKYMQVSTANILLAEISDITFKDNPFKFVHHLVKSLNNELEKNVLDTKKMQTLYMILCYEYQLRFNCNQYRHINSSELCSWDTEQILILQEHWRDIAEIQILHDIILLEFVLYSDLQFLQNRLHKCQDIATVYVVNNESKITYMRMLECFLDCLQLHCVFNNSKTQEELMSFFGYFIKEIKAFVKVKDDIQWRSLASVISKLINTFGGKCMTYPIWDLFLNELKDLKDLLAGLSILIDIYSTLDKEFLLSVCNNLYYEDKFWLSVLQGIRSPIKQYRKWALHLVQKSLDMLDEIEFNKFQEKNKKRSVMVPFMCNAFDEEIMLDDIQQKFFLVLEALEEKQNHLIAPALKYVVGLIKANREHKICGDCFNDEWMRCIFERILQHENNSVVKQGVIDICNIDLIIFNEEFIKLFTNVLNNTFLYEANCSKDEPEIVKALTTLFTGTGKLKLITKFLTYASEIMWGPIALFYVLHSIRVATKQIQLNNTWNSEDLKAIKALVSSNLRMHSYTLRIASQAEMLLTISNFSYQTNDLMLLINVFSVFPSQEALQRGSYFWTVITNWLSQTISKENAIKFFTEMPTKCIKSDHFYDLSPYTLALTIFLFHDAKLAFCDYNCSALVTLNVYLNSLTGSYLRPYSDIVEHINIIELIMHLLTFCEKQNCKTIIQMLSFYGNAVMEFIGNSMKKLTITLCYEDLNKFLNIIEIIFAKAHILMLKKESNKYIENLQNESINLLQDNNIVNLQYVCALHIFFFSQCTRLVAPKIEVCEQIIMNAQIIPTAESKDRSIINSRGKIMSHYHFMIAKLIHYYIQMVPVESWHIEWHKIIMCSLEIEGREIIPVIGDILRTVVDKNAIKNLNELDFKSIFQLCWKITFLNKKDIVFSQAVHSLLTVIIHSTFLNLPDSSTFIDPFVTQLMKEGDNIQNLKTALLSEIEHLNSYEVIKIRQVILECLLHGFALRRDKRIEVQAHLFIKETINGYDLNCFSDIDDFNIHAVVRAKAVTLFYKVINMNPKYVSIFLHSILLKLEQDKQKRYFNDSQLHRMKHRLMQALLILEPLLDEKSATLVMEQLFNSLILESNQHSVRMMQQWMLTRIFINHKNLRHKLWDYFDRALTTRPASTSSFSNIVFDVALHIQTNDMRKFITEAMPYIARCCLGQHYHTRLYNQTILVEFFNILNFDEFQDVLIEYKGLYNAAVISLDEKGSKSIKIKDDFYLFIFDPEKHYSLQTIYYELPRLSGINEDEWIEPDLFNKPTFESKDTHPLSLHNENQLLATYKPITHLVNSSSVDTEIAVDYGENNSPTNVQKKISPFKPLLSPEEDIPYPLGQCLHEKKVEEGIIVISSLIDRPANLGGLARTCEIFGAKELIIGNLNYIKDKEFQCLSVSSDKWINITEVRPYNLREYLLKMKNMGWNLVCAEQTVNSISLLNMKFNSKTVLLLGNEKDGVPASLIPLVDTCVEIPQIGFTRSLNVHVTGAICLWQYATQHMLHTN